MNPGYFMPPVHDFKPRTTIEPHEMTSSVGRLIRLNISKNPNTKRVCRYEYYEGRRRPTTNGTIFHNTKSLSKETITMFYQVGTGAPTATAEKYRINTSITRSVAGFGLYEYYASIWEFISIYYYSMVAAINDERY